MEPDLPQGMYDIEHEELRTLSLFMVPIGPDREGMGYEAVFNPDPRSVSTRVRTHRAQWGMATLRLWPDPLRL